MRSVDSNCGGNLQDRHRYQHSRRGNSSMLQNHSSTSTPMMKGQISLSLVLLIIYIVAQNNDMISTAAAAPRSHDITHIASRRSAFCNAVPMQNKPSFGNTHIKAIRPQQSVLAIQRNTNVMSFAVSSASALRMAEKTSADEIIDLSKLNGDVASEADQQLSHEEYNLCDEAAATLENDSTINHHSGYQATTHSSENSITTTTSSATQVENRAFFAKVTVLFSLAVLAVLKMSPNGCWRYYLAGGICASTSHAITTPIDVVKVS